METKKDRIWLRLKQASVSRKFLAFLFLLIVADYGLTVFAFQTFPFRVHELNMLFFSPISAIAQFSVVILAFWFLDKKKDGAFFNVVIFAAIIVRAVAIGFNISSLIQLYGTGAC